MRLARGVPPALRSLAGCVVVALAVVWSNADKVTLAPACLDDVTWAKRSLAPLLPERPIASGAAWRAESPLHYRDGSWSDEDVRLYAYAIDHPGAARVIYGAVLRAAGISRVEGEEWDGSVTWDEYLRSGFFLPYRPRILLRTVNLAFVSAAAVIAFLGFTAICANRAVSCVAAILVFADPSVRASEYGLVTYIGADAMLAFWSVVVWLAVLKDRRGTVLSAVLAGGAAGAAAASKVNGAFAALAAIGYYMLWQRGRRRWLLAGLAAGVSIAVFLAFNPIFVANGIGGAGQVIRDMLARRLQVVDEHLAIGFNKATRLETMQFVLPQALFLIPAAGMAALAARKWWFRATIVWGLAMVTGNLALLHMFLPKYAAPVRIAFWIVLFAAGASALSEMLSAARRGPQSRPNQRDEGGVQ